MSAIGLLTGSAPFAGLPDSPSAEALAHFEGRVFGDVTIRTNLNPVSLEALPGVVDDLIAKHRPAFVVSLGVALGEPVLRVETSALNRTSFAIADNFGQRPTGGEPLDPAGPAARFATWDHRALVARLLDDGLPAVASHFAGTHLCNATLYLMLGALERHGLGESPCGFFHLPYLPHQVARFLRDAPKSGDGAPTTPRALPSMALDLQLAAISTVLSALAERRSPQAT